jgi:hypothetical protein
MRHFPNTSWRCYCFCQLAQCRGEVRTGHREIYVVGTIVGSTVLGSLKSGGRWMVVTANPGWELYMRLTSPQRTMYVKKHDAGWIVEGDC